MPNIIGLNKIYENKELAIASFGTLGEREISRRDDGKQILARYYDEEGNVASLIGIYHYKRTDEDNNIDYGNIEVKDYSMTDMEYITSIVEYIRDIEQVIEINAETVDFLRARLAACCGSPTPPGPDTGDTGETITCTPPSGWSTGTTPNEMFFSIYALSSGTIRVNQVDSPYRLEYKFGAQDHGWHSVPYQVGTTEIPVQEGTLVEFLGSSQPEQGRTITFSGTDCEFVVYGNLLSLYGGGDDWELHDVNDGAYFPRLFEGCTGLTSAKCFILPATNLTDDNCYDNMFAGCTNMLYPPACLPSVNVPYCGYRAMFKDCTSLLESPEIRAQIVSDFGCNGMFQYCESLQAAPELYITNLNGERACMGMFYGCKNMTSAPMVLIPLSIPESGYSQMFAGCESILDGPEIMAVNVDVNACEGMFMGCISMTAATSTLRSESPSEYCYREMFSGCKNLIEAPVLPAKDIGYTECYYKMFSNCENLNHIVCFAEENTYNYDETTSWVYDVAPSGVFEKPASMDDWEINSDNGIPIGWTVVNRDYERTYLTFKIIEDGAITWYGQNGYELEYSMDDGDNWYPLTSLTLVRGDVVNVRSASNITEHGETIGYFEDDVHIKYEVYGNIMSLLYGDDYIGEDSLNCDYALAGLFDGCKGLTNAENLILPATSITEGGYQSMFNTCVNLKKTPKLPAGEVNVLGYAYMFEGCDSLLAAPQINATYIGDSGCTSMFNNCDNLLSGPFELKPTVVYEYTYAWMFEGCVNLITAPVIRATEGREYAFYSMFDGCESLVNAPVLRFDFNYDHICQSMFAGCTSLTHVPALTANNVYEYSCEGMFAGCTSLEVTPELRFTQIREHGCQSMFEGCTSLTHITNIPNTVSMGVNFDEYGYAMMFKNCTSLMWQHVPQIRLGSRDNGYIEMFYGCTSLANIMGTIYMDGNNNTYERMFMNCSSLTSGPLINENANNPGVECYKQMYKNCTSLTSISLSASDTSTRSHYEMCDGCVSLRNVRCLLTHIDSGATENWMRNVAPEGEFTKARGMEGWETGPNGIPVGWTVREF